MTEAVDLGALVSADGYFLLREPRVAARPFAPPATGESGHYQHVFSYPRSRPAIQEAALELLASARRKIFLASFFVGEPALLDALYAAAERMRGGVYVISALDETSLKRGLATTEAADAPDAADFRAHNKQFEDMTTRGISVRGHENCHAKFLVVDDRVALVSSANLETAALVGSAERAVTGENGVVLSSPREVDRLARFFARLWWQCRFEMPPGEVHTVQERAPARSPCRVPRPEVAPASGVIWTHDDEQVILETVRDVIGRARKRLLLSTFSLNRMQANPELLFDPLRRALDRYELRVSMLSRARNNRPEHRRDAQALAELGVHVYGDGFNHAKGVIADGRHGALFSANFDAQHGLTSGVEVGVRLDGEVALADAVGYFEHAVGHADLIFATRPSQREMNERFGGRWRSSWTLETNVRVAAPEGLWDRFVVSAADAPVLFEHGPEGDVLLYAGRARWRLSRPASDGRRRLSESAAAQDKPASEVLGEWIAGRKPGEGRSGRDGGREPRGFCPAVVRRVV